MVLEVICWLVIILVMSWKCFTYNFDFWKRRNVKGPTPIPIFGNYAKNIFGRIHAAELTKEFYDKFPGERMVGYFVNHSPVLMLRDPDLISDVLIKDFAVFSDRGISVHDRVEPLSQHFFNLPEASWRPLRAQMTAAFTSSNLKDMFVLTLDVAERFVTFIESESRKSESLECCQLMAKFTTEAVGECGFGLKMNEFAREVTEFRKLSKNRLQSSWYNFFKRFLREFCPKIYKCCSIFRNDKIRNLYVSIISQVAEYREIMKRQKSDYIGLLIDLKDNVQKNNNIELSDNVLAAQAYVFFTAGSDTTAMIISNILYELAINASIQDKLREEINVEKLTFQNTKKMKYLDKVLKETLRKYPLRNIIRKSNKSYTFSSTNVTIPANTHIVIPHYAIHRDKQFYSEPEIFNPERFHECTKKTYLPFGSGPRNCIGAQFAVLVSKIVIVKILQNLKVETSNNVYSRNKNDPKKVFLSPKEGIHLRFKKL